MGALVTRAGGVGAASRSDFLPLFCGYEPREMAYVGRRDDDFVFSGGGERGSLAGEHRVSVQREVRCGGFSFPTHVGPECKILDANFREAVKCEVHWVSSLTGSRRVPEPPIRTSRIRPVCLTAGRPVAATRALHAGVARASVRSCALQCVFSELENPWTHAHGRKDRSPKRAFRRFKPACGNTKGLKKSEGSRR